jgi:F-type H+-transporting ATPase subunit epsilon
MPMADRTPTTPVDQAHLLNRPLRCVVVTPEATILDRAAEFVALPLDDGEIGIGRGHSPLIGRLGYGEMRLRTEDDKTERYYVDGGFVQVVGNVVSVLTAEAILATELDPSIAAERLREAHSQVATSDTLFDQRDRLESQARAQLRIVHHAK